jgi:hypothetical protein
MVLRAERLTPADRPTCNLSARRDSISGGAYVDLARYRGGDERGPQFLEAVDCLADAVDEPVDSFVLVHAEGRNLALFREWRDAHVKTFDVANVDSVEGRSDHEKFELPHHGRTSEEENKESSVLRLSSAHAGELEDYVLVLAALEGVADEVRYPPEKADDLAMGNCRGH